jgi:hypothetical protein
MLWAILPLHLVNDHHSTNKKNLYDVSLYNSLILFILYLIAFVTIRI